MLRKIEEKVFKFLMLASLAAVLASLLVIIATVVMKGAGSVNFDTITKTPGAGYYLGGGGGILNAIVGSAYLAVGATLLAFIISIGVATWLQKEYTRSTAAGLVRGVLDLLWGIPSIVYGVFCFVIMVFFGLGTSLLAGIIALTFLEIPIMTRCMDEAISAVSPDLKVSAYVLGSNRIETSAKVVLKQATPGIISGVLLAFGRGIGDAASILFTAGFTDYIPARLTDSAAALPTMIFFLATSPFPQVRERAYAAAFILLIVVLLISVISRLLTLKLSKYLVR
jgi:phosphate transport system permease protein